MIVSILPAIGDGFSSAVSKLNTPRNFKDAIDCHICSKPLGTNRVRDHDHLTGVYRGAAHQNCNLEYRIPEQYPVVFHNLKNFDGHIIINALDTNFCKSEPVIIPHTIEKYIGFFLGKFKFMDSFAFLSSSLDNLAANVPTDKKDYYLKQVFGDIDTSLLLRKSALPYEYLSSLDVFNETALPDKSAFFSSLTQSNISDELYENVKKVWSKFNCSTLKDLHDIYLKVDVLLLASVFENFREMSLFNFALDPLHQFSAPGLTWSAAFKKMKIELELLTDFNMFLMVEKGIRGGPTSVVKRHVRANNQYLPDYDPSKQTSFLLYLDVNNLYGYAMSEKLPKSHFKWSSRTIEEILTTPDDSEIGFILEVDIEYPCELHDDHNDFPLAPEKMEITPDMYSQYQKDLLDELKGRGYKRIKTAKLTNNFYKKIRYVVHYRNLKFYHSHGMKVVKLHRAIEFKQSSWLADYVSFCTTKRQAAVTDFEKDFWKLLVNSIYGKMIEDKRKHRIVKIALQDVEAQRLLKNETCDKFIILDDNKMLFSLKKLSVVMDKPIAVGFTILELAKLKMYQLHYDTFKPYYKSNISLVYTDTDSFIYEIKSEDIVADMRQFANIMDFSNYPKGHPLYSNNNNKKIGYLKDEMAGKQISEFIGIKPKLYALRICEEVIKRARGVPRPILKNRITFQDYLDCLYNHDTRRDVTTTLQSDRHNIQMIRRQKTTISSLEDKRYWVDPLKSLAYGHHDIQ
ncbi:uncharacterized protein LOC112539813 [Tetranychus urticae]|uniref:uncharacterized protein LOC112539813 n=1 Tax=Tetranychus urticae TaxID=32264 RepID=UPI000D6458BC|nr:uncharacterized protein LOC112539813 [Tetranychus urticae]